MAFANEILFDLDRSWNNNIEHLVHKPKVWPDEIPKAHRYWGNAVEYDPPLPRAVPGKGFPVWAVNTGEFTVYFGSSRQVDHFADVWSRKILPTTRQLGEQFGTGQVSQIWLGRFPKPKWEKRLELTDYVAKHRALFDDLVATLV